jgi:hypothetical protein
LDTISENHTGRKIASWGETAAGILPVLTLSLATTLEGTSNQTLLSFLPVYILIFLLYALPAIGVPLAVKRGIPRWSSPYLALLVLDLLLLPVLFSAQFDTATGGIWSFGIVLIVVLLCGGFMLVKYLRSQDAQTEKSSEHDWTQILLGIQTLTPIYLLIVFDEIDTTFKSPFIILGGVILAAGAVVYLRTRWRWLGLAALLGSLLLVVLPAKNIARVYWSTHPWG